MQTEVSILLIELVAKVRPWQPLKIDLTVQPNVYLITYERYPYHPSLDYALYNVIWSDVLNNLNYFDVVEIDILKLIALCNTLAAALVLIPYDALDMHVHLSSNASCIALKNK